MTRSIDNHWPRHVTVVGVGLLGGSIPLSLRRHRPECSFVGVGRSEDKCGLLVESGIVDAAHTDIGEACQDADIVVIALPVDRIADAVIQAAQASPKNCLISDVGSTKAGIIRAIEGNSEAARKFVAAHPIAGSEKSGYQHASAELYDGKTCIITPTEQNDPSAVEATEHFWKLLGMQSITMSAEQHDTHLAAISHMPHLVSALVARLATDQARSLAGSGWEDITRVAAGDPTMWTAICRQNRPAIVEELDRLSVELDQLRKILDADASAPAIFDWLSEAKRIKEKPKN